MCIHFTLRKPYFNIFSIGSLNIEYQVYGGQQLNNATLNKMIIDSFKQQSDVQASDGRNSLTGKIDPQSQQLIGTLFFIFKKKRFGSSLSLASAVGITEREKQE